MTKVAAKSPDPARSSGGWLRRTSRTHARMRGIRQAVSDRNRASSSARKMAEPNTSNAPVRHSTSEMPAPGPSSPDSHRSTVEGTLGSCGMTVATAVSTPSHSSIHRAVRIRVSQRQPIRTESHTKRPSGTGAPAGGAAGRIGGFWTGGAADSMGTSRGYRRPLGRLTDHPQRPSAACGQGAGTGEGALPSTSTRREGVGRRVHRREGSARLRGTTRAR